MQFQSVKAEDVHKTNLRKQLGRARGILWELERSQGCNWQFYSPRTGKLRYPSFKATLRNILGSTVANTNLFLMSSSAQKMPLLHRMDLDDDKNYLKQDYVTFLP